MTEQEKFAVRSIAKIVQEAVAEAGVAGIPAGSLYAMLMTWGCTLSQFDALIGGMVQLGMLERSGDILRSTL